MSANIDDLQESPATEHPEMLRKYGRNDFERFDHLRPSVVPHGSAAVGKVLIDCRFLFTKSKWGLLHYKPGGIVYMDLSFTEPKGYRLRSATVTVTLDEASDELNRVFRGPQTGHLRPRMTEYYGPRNLVGTSRAMHKKRKIRLAPNVEFGGVGAGLGEISTETSALLSSRWRFSGNLHRYHDQRSPFYQSIQWELSENDFEEESSHSSVMHTAFALQHDARPFFLRVNIEGKLRSTHHRVLNKFSKLRISSKDEEKEAATLINFRQSHQFDRPLDALAKGLRYEMEQANLEAVPVEVWEPQKPSFHTLTPETSPNGSVHAPMHGPPPTSVQPHTAPQPQMLDPRPQPALLPGLPQRTQSLPMDPVARQTPLADLETLRDLASLLHTPLTLPLPRRVAPDLSQVLSSEPEEMSSDVGSRSMSEPKDTKEQGRRMSIRLLPIASRLRGANILASFLIVMQTIMGWLTAFGMTLVAVRPALSTVVPEPEE